MGMWDNVVKNALRIPIRKAAGKIGSYLDYL
jgi:hypothetical protein